MSAGKLSNYIALSAMVHALAFAYSPRDLRPAPQASRENSPLRVRMGEALLPPAFTEREEPPPAQPDRSVAEEPRESSPAEPVISEYSFDPQESDEEIRDETPNTLGALSEKPAQMQASGTAERAEAILNLYLRQLQERLEQYKRYPYPARRTGMSGTVLLELNISEDGRADEISVRRKCPFLVLTRAALETVRAAEPFPKPPPELTRPVRVQVPISFVLH